MWHKMSSDVAQDDRPTGREIIKRQPGQLGQCNATLCLQRTKGTQTTPQRQQNVVREVQAKIKNVVKRKVVKVRSGAAMSLE